MHFFEKHGVGIKSKEELFIDAMGVREKNILISHAHSDHAKPTSTNKYFTTAQTAELIKKSDKNISIVPFKKKFNVGEFEVSFHPSGHILGSAQIKISNSIEAVVTTDFKMQKSILFEPAEILKCDTLVIESTFGVPKFSFPPRQEVYTEMIKWCNEELSKNHFIVLGGYATGKAQELTKFSNDFLNHPPIVHKKVFVQNKVYEKFGLKLGKYFELDHNLSDSNILIVPPHIISENLLHAISLQINKKISCAIATGWNFYSRYKVFPLSDHADFSQLVKYVKESGAKRVFTYHGFDKEFAIWITKNLKINAMPLKMSSQKTLAEAF